MLTPLPTKILNTIVVLCLMAFRLAGQDVYTISGKVLDDTQQPLPFGKISTSNFKNREVDEYLDRIR